MHKDILAVTAMLNPGHNLSQILLEYDSKPLFLTVCVTVLRADIVPLWNKNKNHNMRVIRVQVMNVSLFNSLEDVKIPSSAHPNEMNDLDMQTH